MREVIYLCGKDKKNIIATNHCKARFKESNSQGIEIVEIDNILTAGMNFTDDYVKYLAEKICDMINEDIQSGLTGKYKEGLYEE